MVETETLTADEAMLSTVEAILTADQAILSLDWQC